MASRKKKPVTKKTVRPATKKFARKKLSKSSRPKPLTHLNIGTPERRIPVGLSYKIVELFSEGLYASANKAFEELVTNSFDAGASNVVVVPPPDPHAADASIVVVDDGEAMDVDGLEQLWQIGYSRKRIDQSPPRGRTQIGKFGIGKLATYVLANELTYVCKVNGAYHAVTMNYKLLDAASNPVEKDDKEKKAKKKTKKKTKTKSAFAAKGLQGLGWTEPLQLEIRSLTVSEARQALAPWLQHAQIKQGPIKLFGPGCARTWTFSVLSSLKEKANEIEPGRLRWILRTALPLRDDFSIYLDGDKLRASRESIPRIGRWVLGKDIKKLPKLADEFTVRIDRNEGARSPLRYGLYHPQLGRVTGYAEAYKDPLTTGKSRAVGRSYGFFVYVRGRLVNIRDEYFGIDSNLLRHGTFARFRMVVHVDGLDTEIQSTREGVREGPSCQLVRELLHAVFNFVRPRIKKADDAEAPGARLARRIAASPASLTRTPILALVKAALAGNFAPRYVSLPAGLRGAARTRFIEKLAARAADPAEFIAEVELSTDLADDDGVAIYDADSGTLKINALHPFVGAFYGNYEKPKENAPLELLALAEVLLEAQLFYDGFEEADIHDFLATRDELLRFLGRSSGRRNALRVSADLRNARNDRNQLQIELVASFDSLGFDTTLLAKSGEADGIAVAHLSGHGGAPRKYSVSLEAKSKQKDGTKVTAKAVNISGIARQRDDIDCDHAIVCGPDFPTSEQATALKQELASRREADKDRERTITLIRIDDLARLVSIAPQRHLVPSELRDLFETCSTP